MKNIGSGADGPIVDGKIQYGRSDRAFKHVNLRRPPGAGPLAYTRLKEWQHYALVHPDVYISVAAVDAKLLGTSWIFVFDRRTRTSFEHARNGPFAGITLPDSLFHGHFEYLARDYAVTGRNNLAEGYHELILGAGDGSAPSIGGSLTMRPEDESPLVAVLPLPNGKPFYSLKTPLTLEGEVKIGDETFTFEPGRDVGLLDEHKAHYPRKTFWRWATFACRRDTHAIGINLTHNVIEDDTTYNENGLWIDGRIEQLGPARFEIPKDPAGDWSIRTLDDRADLNFTPQGVREEDLNRLIARSWYRQPVGLYNGVVRDNGGNKHEIKDVFGIAEDHRVTW